MNTSDWNWVLNKSQDTVVSSQIVDYGSHSAEFAPHIRPGVIVRNVQTSQERVVVSYRPDKGLIEFEDSNLLGWSDAQGWVPTGKTATP